VTHGRRPGDRGGEDCHPHGGNVRRRFVLSSGGGVLMTYVNEPAAIPRLKTLTERILS